jgi:pimeloyl-ACP methyl ester carboxylesterase
MNEGVRLNKAFTRFSIALLAWTAVASPLQAAEGQEKEKLPAVAWHECDRATPPGFDCATYPAPLDYARPHEKEIALALIRHQAPDQEHRIGAVFFNPGGPGGQGTLDLPGWLSLFPAAVQARFDLVSWDPRGIGASTAVQCFASKAEETAFFANVAPSIPVGAEQERVWLDTYTAFGKICKQRNGELLAHVSTADSARDMERLRQALGEPSMNYLGLSYGTLLGAEYANMFPDKIRAMVLDGNIDPAAWRNDQGLDPVLSTSLRLKSDLAAAKSLKAFLDLCGEAGTEKCTFSAGNAEQTHQKFNRLLERLKQHSVMTQP